MGLAQIVCRGLGPGATIALLLTTGYGSAGVIPPSPPPPVVVGQDATPGRLTRAQIARLRGEATAIAVPPTPVEDRETADDAGGASPAPVGGTLLDRPHSLVPQPVAPTDIAQAVQPAALADLARRQTLARHAQEARDEEEALGMLLMLLEEL